MLFRALIAAFVLALAVGFAIATAGSHRSALADPAVPAGDLGPTPLARVPALSKPAAAAPARAARPGVDVYRGVGAWVDMYDPAELGNPWPALVEMKQRGVRTLYFE